MQIAQPTISRPETAAPVIQVEGLTKSFRTYKKQPGFGGAIRGLFHRKYEQTVAVKDVNFVVEGKEIELDRSMLDAWWSSFGFGDIYLWRTYERDWSQPSPNAK